MLLMDVGGNHFTVTTLSVSILFVVLMSFRHRHVRIATYSPIYVTRTEFAVVRGVNSAQAC